MSKATACDSGNPPGVQFLLTAAPRKQLPANGWDKKPSNIAHGFGPLHTDVGDLEEAPGFNFCQSWPTEPSEEQNQSMEDFSCPLSQLSQINLYLKKRKKRKSE